jgi:hypothetical protein
MELTQDWRKLHNAECHNLYPSPVTMVKSRQIRYKNSYVYIYIYIYIYTYMYTHTHGKQQSVCKHNLSTFKIREEDGHYSFTVLYQLT